MKQYIAISCGEMYLKDEGLIQDTICWLVELEPRTESCYCYVKGCDDYEPNNRFIDVIMQFPSGKAAEDVHELQLPQVWGPSSVDEDPLAASETRLPRLQDLEALRRRKSFKWFNKCVGRWRVASTPPDIGVGSHS